MIKANELRVGNWVSNFKGEPYQITPRFFSSVASGLSWEEQKAAGYAELNYSAQPIPLTPDIFSKSGVSWVAIEDQTMDGIVHTLHLYFEGWKSPSLHYVHQLQNLYHALTGDELNIEL